MSTKKIKIIFMGTPEFAVPGLKSLLNDSRFEIKAVFTQADKKIGRQQILSEPPIKKLSKEYNIPTYQPLKIREGLETIIKLQPDLIIVIAYGQIIPQSILDIPKYTCINIHASLLPKYRGAACINAPLLNGDKESGISIMQMDANLDTGPIIRQEKVILDPQENLNTLSNKLSILGSKILPETLIKFINKEISLSPQNNNQSSYIGLLSKQDGLIDWHKPAKEIERMVRALNPWPGTYTRYKGKTLKIISVNHEIIETEKYKIGEVFEYQKYLAIKTGQNALLILTLQIEGAKKISSKDFFNGHKDIISSILK